MRGLFLKEGRIWRDTDKGLWLTMPNGMTHKLTRAALAKIIEDAINRSNMQD